MSDEKTSGKKGFVPSPELRQALRKLREAKLRKEAYEVSRRVRGRGK